MKPNKSNKLVLQGREYTKQKNKLRSELQCKTKQFYSMNPDHNKFINELNLVYQESPRKRCVDNFLLTFDCRILCADCSELTPF